VVIVILLSPLAYWGTGVGQAAGRLSAEIARALDGTLVSSPKAEALHRLALPMRVERLLVYPLLLAAFQLSGGALALRRWLEGKVHTPPPGQVQILPLPQRWMGRLIPHAWRQRLAGRDLLVVLGFVLILDLAIALFYLPFNYYSGFILAHQFDLSTQTAPGWAGDWLKNLVITLVIDGLVWTGFYALLRLMPRRWPIPAGALLVLFSAAFVLAEPLVITPLFYQVRPLDDAGLRTRILALAGRADMHVDEVYVINASTKTTEANAYFTGFGGAQRIVLFDTLLTGYTPDQVEVVLAHEMGHWYYRHVWLGLLGMGAAGWIGLFGLRWLLKRSWQRLGLSGPADVAGLPYLLAVVAIVTALSLPFLNGLSRFGERQADRFALQVSHKPGVFIELFERLAVQNLSPVDAPAWEKLIFYTHPSIAERIRMAEGYITDY
jgi:STE24 endopeptidase